MDGELALYTEWYDRVTELTLALSNDPAFANAEDLGDFVDMIGTIMSFGPNPRTMLETRR